jgi:hypothetical protein
MSIKMLLKVSILNQVVVKSEEKVADWWATVFNTQNQNIQAQLQADE